MADFLRKRIKKIKNKIPRYVKRVLAQLSSAGYQSYVVGGSVRDLLLGLTPKDWDIATNATPTQVQKVFDKTIPTGLKYGTITVIIGKNQVQVTTYRGEGAYEKSRFPKSVKFLSDLPLDLSRRDFTVNALAWNEPDGLIDLYEGQKNLKSKTLVAVGQAEKRFHEDALRILRAGRFLAQLQFKPSPDLSLGAKSCAHLVKELSHERITTEFEKLSMSQHPEIGLSWLMKVGVLEVIFEFPEATNISSFNRKIKKMRELPLELTARMAYLTSLLSELGRKAPRDILNVFTFSKKLKSNIEKITLALSLSPNRATPFLRKVVHELGEDLTPIWLSMVKTLKSPETKFYKKLERISHEPIYVLSATGQDIQTWLQITEGKMIGIYLNNLWAVVYESPKMNKKQLLKKLIYALK